MASRRSRTGSRWTPTKPAPETSVALPPGAGESREVGPEEPSVEVFLAEAGPEPTPVEAALARAEPEPAAEPVTEPAELPVPAAEPVADEAGPSASAPQALAVEVPAPDAPPAVPVSVGFPRRAETIRAATPLSEINATLVSFVRSEGQAALAHLDALSKATSPADAVRLQFSEIQRAADASLTCFGALLRTANRFGPPPRS